MSNKNLLKKTQYCYIFFGETYVRNLNPKQSQIQLVNYTNKKKCILENFKIINLFMKILRKSTYYGIFSTKKNDGLCRRSHKQNVSKIYRPLM